MITIFDENFIDSRLADTFEELQYVHTFIENNNQD